MMGSLGPGLSIDSDRTMSSFVSNVKYLMLIQDHTRNQILENYIYGPQLSTRRHSFRSPAPPRGLVY